MKCKVQRSYEPAVHVLLVTKVRLFPAHWHVAILLAVAVQVNARFLFSAISCAGDDFGSFGEAAHQAAKHLELARYLSQLRLLAHQCPIAEVHLQLSLADLHLRDVGKAVSLCLYEIVPVWWCLQVQPTLAKLHHAQACITAAAHGPASALQVVQRHNN